MTPPLPSQGDSAAQEDGGAGPPVSAEPGQPARPVPPAALPRTPADVCWRLVLRFVYYWCPVLGMQTALLVRALREQNPFIWFDHPLWILISFVPYINWVVYLLLLPTSHHQGRPPSVDAALLCFYVLLFLLAAWLVALPFSRRGGRA